MRPAVGVEIKFEIKIRNKGMQWSESLLYLIRKLKLNKQNNQALNSLIDLIFYFELTYILHMTSIHNFHLSNFTFLR